MHMACGLQSTQVMLNHTFKSVFSILAVASPIYASFASTTAYAFEPEVTPPAPAAATHVAPASTQAPFIQAVRADIGLGFVSSKGSDFGGALVVDGLVTVGHGYFAAGVTGELGTGIWGNNRLGFGGVAGIALPRTSPVEISLLAEGGLHAYSRVSSGKSTVLSGDPGTGGSLGYAGLRLALNIPVSRLPDGSPRPTLGVALYARIEPSSSSRSYSYTETSLFSDRTRTENATVKLGGTSEFGLTLRCGVDWFAASR
jgi:hypothetical protein